jgi:hypothetical protein
MPRIFDDVAECVETTLGRVGPHIVLALPLGIGKPNPLANEFYRRALRSLEAKTHGAWPRMKALVRALRPHGTSAAVRPYLNRMSLVEPRTRQEWLWQRLLVQELRDIV